MARQRGRMMGGMMSASTTYTIVVIALLLIFIGVGVYIYYQYNQSTLEKKKNNIANAKGGKAVEVNNMTGSMDTYEDGTLDVMFFNVDWCPHCVRAKPDWEQFTKKYNNQNIKGYTVTCVGGQNGINCTNTDDATVKQSITRYNIQHYPTLIFVQNGSQVEFDAKINMKNLDDFMDKL